MDKQDKPAAFSNEESAMLLSIYGQPEIQLKFKTQKKSHNIIWKEIAEQLMLLSERKFARTDQQCRDRIGNLKKKYFVLKREIRSGDSPPTWVFWEDMNTIFGPRPTATPKYMLDSLQDNSSSPDTNQESLTEEESTSMIDLSIASTSSQDTGTPAMKRCQPNPNSFRRTKKRLTEPSTGILQCLERMEEKEEEYMARSEKRDNAFLKLLGNISDSVKKIADGKVTNTEASQMVTEDNAPQFEYFYVTDE